MTKFGQLIYDEKIEYGKEVARKVSREAATKYAKLMLENGVDVQLVKKVTQLPEEEVMAL